MQAWCVLGFRCPVSRFAAADIQQSPLSAWTLFNSLYVDEHECGDSMQVCACVPGVVMMFLLIHIDGSYRSTLH